ncbi:MAG: class I SAM-dependent methyltransferase [Gemmatimonadetes bacterium]|uniref:Class I SAM-dependent methyltransferase n=1 Tax=Candidatus Kutchimonas denitrificans TaxID=3056748 RepID=A0AAE4Z8L1_9BACT|nr:class I SAM-dependent methyltransferase [Gemmatimonadota bacterium]NIR75274.1 class I SAM-dependent methyltransferase [Candidatus Kutchimonas denitrificans]NIS00212.1 class I SAM-dependent methyltransferase [Gemmatimonadota bacterium]NIT65804.1 class I SAM-dependent methyltransferase [Gemmatimonadota bacterium]NIU53082.1 methyltransferase domain-containing protein [Gemmatimonadota bacterium]
MSETRRLPEWYRDWFGEEYLALYPHRDEEEARDGVELVMQHCGRVDGLVLDLACGAGRHMLHFRRLGVTPVGLDLSASLLRQARDLDSEMRLVRGDMRHLPFADSSFALVANFFTSFGYFAEPEEDRRVLGEIRRVLRGGGCFALDFLNAQRVRDGLVPRDERKLGDRRVVQERRLEEDGRVVVKEIKIYGATADRPESVYFERVRLYEPDELVTLLRNADLEPKHTFGDYTGGPACPDCARYILIGYAT